MKHYNVRRTSDSSAQLNWSQADLLTDFCFPWEQSVVPSTEFRALWDEQYLFFRFDCVDEDLVLGHGETLKDRVLESDRVEIFLTPDLSLTPYYCFEMSPRGEALIYQARFHRQINWDWSGSSLEIKAGIESPHYWVEGKWPMSALRELEILKPNSTHFFAGVYRGEFSHLPIRSVKNGWITWVNPETERPDFHVPESFGIFKLIY